MKEFLFLAAGFLLGLIAAKYFKQPELPAVNPETVFKNPNQEKIEQKQKHLAAIMEYFNAHNQAANDEIERMLNVSNATAERYLNELEQQGKIIQIGKTGRGVIYRKA